MKNEKNYAVKNAGAFENLTREVFNESLDLSAIELSINRMKAGESSPFVHAHKRNEEVYVFIKGKGAACIDGEEFPVNAGDVMRIDPEGKRAFRADASEDLLYICVQAEKASLVQHTGNDGFPAKEKPSWMQKQ